VKLNKDKVKSHAETVSSYKKYVDTVNYDGIDSGGSWPKT